MGGYGKRRTFNIVVGVLVAIAAVVLAYLVWGTTRTLFTERDELPEPPSPIVGEARETAPAETGADPISVGSANGLKPTAGPLPQAVTLTLPNGTRVRGTETEAELQRYLASDAPAGRRFVIRSIDFTERDEVRPHPPGALTTLGTILNAYPEARIRVEVIERNPQMFEPRDRATDRAHAAARAIAATGVDADRMTHVGIKSQEADVPVVALVVTEK